MVPQVYLPSLHGGQPPESPLPVKPTPSSPEPTARGSDSGCTVVSTATYPLAGVTDVLRERFDDAGHLVWREFDADADGKVETVRRIDYRNDGLIARLFDDRDADGYWDASTVYHYDRKRLVAEESFGQHGGIPIMRDSFDYNPEGNMVEHRIDSNADGQVDRIFYYEYTEEGLREWERSWARRAGVFATDHYSWDDHGRLVQLEGYLGEVPGGVLAFRLMYAYDDQGRLVDIRDDTGLVTLYSYDEFDQLSAVYEYRSGGLHYQTTFEYGSEGRLVRTVNWHHGQLESDVSFIYECHAA